MPFVSTDKKMENNLFLIVRAVWNNDSSGSISAEPAVLSVYLDIQNHDIPRGCSLLCQPDRCDEEKKDHLLLHSQPHPQECVLSVLKHLPSTYLSVA